MRTAPKPTTAPESISRWRAMASNTQTEQQRDDDIVLPVDRDELQADRACCIEHGGDAHG